MKIKKYEFHHIAMVQKNLNDRNETSQKHIREKISVVQSSHTSSDKKTMMVHPNNASIEINDKYIYFQIKYLLQTEQWLILSNFMILQLLQCLIFLHEVG